MWRVIGGAWGLARQAGAALTRDLWPTWQGGLQDAQTMFTRMTLDAPVGASVPGQAGVSTAREQYETLHPDGPGDGRGGSFDEYLRRQADRGHEAGQQRGPDQGLGPGL